MSLLLSRREARHARSYALPAFGTGIIAGWLLMGTTGALPLRAQGEASPAARMAARAPIEIPDLQTADEARVGAAWVQLQTRLEELEATDPGAAVALCGQFLDKGGARYGAVAIEVAARVAAIEGYVLRDFDKAIEAYNWGIANFPDHPGAARLQQLKLAALQAEKRHAQGATLPPVSVGALTPTVSPLAPVLVAPPFLGAASIAPLALSPEIVKPPLVAPIPVWAMEKPPALLPVKAPLVADLLVPRGDALGWTPGRTRAVTALAREANGVLWVATEDSGVWRYDEAAAPGARWRQFTAGDGLGDGSVYALAVDQQGRVWAGTLAHGVAVWNGKTWRNYGVLDGPVGERVFDIAVCSTDGDVWMATSAGLSRYSVKNDAWSSFTRAEGLPANQVQALAFDARGDLLAGTQCEGIALAYAADNYKNWHLTRGAEAMPTTPTGTGLPGNLINDVLVARDGSYYVGTTTGLAWSRDKGRSWNYVRGRDYAAKVRGLEGGPPAGWQAAPGAVLAEDYVSCLAEDGAGRIWVGHWRAGDQRLEMNDGPLGGVKRIFGAESSGFVKAILPVPNASPLLARYDQGVGRSLLGETKAAPMAANSLGPVRAQNASTAAPAWPSPAAPPTVEQLQRLTRQSPTQRTPLEPNAVYLGEDWITGGDWLRGYGSRYSLMCAMQAPLDSAVINDLSYYVRGRLGQHADAGDGLRRWLDRKRWDDRRVLYNPTLGYRRQADWDDHGEVYPAQHQGPDIWVGVTVPAGTHRVSLYFFNKDGHDGDNRARDYLVEVYQGTQELQHSQTAPVLARARVRDFWGGVYKTFVVQGAGDYFFRIRKNNSFNTIVQAVLIDKTAGPPTAAEGVRDVWMGRVRYEAPQGEVLADLETSALNSVASPQKPLLQAAFALWKAAETSGEATLQHQNRLLCYRAVHASGADNAAIRALLRAWRWTFPLWPQEDRQEFDEVAAQGWQSVTSINPRLLSSNR